jgi:hypothetical protein
MRHDPDNECAEKGNKRVLISAAPETRPDISEQRPPEEAEEWIPVPRK